MVRFVLLCMMYVLKFHQKEKSRPQKRKMAPATTRSHAAYFGTGAQAKHVLTSWRNVSGVRTKVSHTWSDYHVHDAAGGQNERSKNAPHVDQLETRLKKKPLVALASEPRRLGRRRTKKDGDWLPCGGGSAGLEGRGSFDNVYADWMRR